MNQSLWPEKFGSLTGQTVPHAPSPEAETQENTWESIPAILDSLGPLDSDTQLNQHPLL